MQHVIQMLKNGKDVRIVCFGDSITGRYYHTGSRLAYPDLVEQGLRRLFPKGQITVINAGISGNSTPAGLKRMDRDVISKKPHLVIVMYGMNDLVMDRQESFAANMKTIIKRARDSGAAVLLCTQNSIYPGSARRPQERLARYTQIIRDVGKETNASVADCYAAYEAIRERDPKEWAMLMSETIHPNLNGHRVFAQTIVECITGSRLPLSAFANTKPAIPLSLAKLRSQRPLKATLVGLDEATFKHAMHKVFPKANVTVVERSLAQPSVVSMAKQAKTLFAAKGDDILVIRLPAEPVSMPDEAYRRQVFTIVRHSVRFGYKAGAREVLWVLPSVTDREASPAVRQREKLIRALAHAGDIGAVCRPADNDQPAADVIASWLRDQSSTK